MIVLDSSAIIAMVLGEKGSNALARRLQKAAAGERFLSTANYVEAGTVLAGRAKNPASGLADIDDFVVEFGITLVDVDAEQARRALAARIKFGRGFGAKADLNFGDCFAYALAKAKGAPLLFTGDDFSKTDVERAT